MDTYLVRYLRSGRAWVLVGSGPSIQAGYPSWNDLAEAAANLVARDGAGNSRRVVEAQRDGDYPRAFEEAAAVVGMPSLVQTLRERLVPSGNGSSRVYDFLSRWPVSVYLTTNFDDELQSRLSAGGNAFRAYSNSQEHMALLLEGMSGAIFKLHGDLTSTQGLVLTSSQYRDLEKSADWSYWRSKMQAVFMQQPVIIVGHSLADPNIRAVLEAARIGSGVVQPVCWVAPNVTRVAAQSYLERYRIRVIPYEDLDDTHRYLGTLIRDITRFTPPRTSIQPTARTSELLRATTSSDASAALFVFSRLAGQRGFDGRRLEAMLALIESALPSIPPERTLSGVEILKAAGWEDPSLLPEASLLELLRTAVRRGFLLEAEGLYRAAPETKSSRQQRAVFQHLQGRFVDALRLRLRRDFPTMATEQAARVAADIDKALIGYFKCGGLTLATLLFAGENARALPTSILDFIMDAAAQYPDPLSRQAFADASISMFVEAGTTEREYLGRLSQGFLAATIIGQYGSLARQRLTLAQSTVWLLDSNVQIPAVALAAPSHETFRDCLQKLASQGVRLFTTEKLFDETVRHLRFAQEVVGKHGESSPYVIAGAQGNDPYRSQNQFLQGFIRWQYPDRQGDWGSYLFASLGQREPGPEDVKRALLGIGIEVIPFSEWPGFRTDMFPDRQAALEKLKDLMVDRWGAAFAGEQRKLEDKVAPEAEAFVIVDRERDGSFHMLSREAERTSAYFVSSTSLINVLSPHRVTWQPEMYLQFANSMLSDYTAATGNRAFDLTLWSLAQSGVTVLDESTVRAVFGGVVDQSALIPEDQQQAYESLLEDKYGEPRDAVLARVPYSDRGIAEIQLANELLDRQGRALTTAEESARASDLRATNETRRATKAEATLAKVAKYKQKLDDKQARGVKRLRRSQSTRGKHTSS
jgi:hypothetical protein